MLGEVGGAFRDDKVIMDLDSVSNSNFHGVTYETDTSAGMNRGLTSLASYTRQLEYTVLVKLKSDLG